MNWEKASIISACNSGNNLGIALVSWVRMRGIWYGFSVIWEPRVNLDCNSWSGLSTGSSSVWMCSPHQEIGWQTGYVLVPFASRLLAWVYSRQSTSPSELGFWRDVLETTTFNKSETLKLFRAHLLYSELYKFWRVLQIINCTEVREYRKSKANGRKLLQLQHQWKCQAFI